MSESKAINKRLYEIRLERNESLKEAAKGLKISSLKLSLIEKGYLYVSKRNEDRFISYCHLENDFFLTHHRYTSSINPVNEDSNKNKKQLNFFSKKRIKIISFILMFANVAGLSTGIYLMERQYANPRYCWNERFTKLNENAKNEELFEKTSSIESVLKLDSYYNVIGEQFETTLEEYNLHYTIDSSMYVYEKDENSSDIEINSKVVFKIGEENSLEEYGEIKYNFSCYNNRKIVYCTYTDYLAAFSLKEGVSSASALGFLNDNGIELRSLSYTIEGESKIDPIGGEYHQEFTELFNDYIEVAYAHFDVCLLYYLKVNGLDLGYDSLVDIVNDVQKVSRSYVASFRWGNILTIVCTIVAILSFAVLMLSFYCSHLLKSKPVIKTNNESDNEYMISTYIAKREIKDDIRYQPLIPEFSLRIVGLLTILFSSILIFASAFMLLHGSFGGLTDVKAVKLYSNNALIAGTTLLFFLKLEIYSKKTHKDILINIFMLLIAGFFYYFFEVILSNFLLLISFFFPQFQALSF